MKTGRVVAAHGRRFLIEAGDGVVECVTRGRKSDIVCGDQVDFAMTDADKGVIEKVAARKNLLYRSDEFRSKLIAANLDLAVVVVAVSLDRKSTRLNSSHTMTSRMPSSA